MSSVFEDQSSGYVIEEFEAEEGGDGFFLVSPRLVGWGVVVLVVRGFEVGDVVGRGAAPVSRSKELSSKCR